jgi:uncharacterized membrane protein
MMLVTPPFQVPDEPAHFYRSFSVSEGTVFVEKLNGMPGAQLPSSLHLLVGVMIDDVPFHPETKLEPGCWQTARAIELDADTRRFLHFPTASQFSALPYIPQAAAIAVGRSVGASPLTLLFLGRFANLVVATTLIFFAIGQLPGYRWLAVLLALMPMALFLRASVSADALTMAVAFVFTAVVAKLAFGKVPPARLKDLAVLLLSSAALCLTKPVYFPLVLGMAAIPSSRFPGRRKGLVLLAALAISACTFVVALAIALPSVYAISFFADSHIEDALRHPFRLVGIVVVDAARNGPRYAAEFIGRLGWLDTPLPFPMVLGYFFTLVMFTFVDTGREAVLHPWQRAVLGAVSVLSIVAVGAAMYVLVGRIEGIQGRYFHPVALAAAWVLHTERWWRTWPTAWTRLGTALLTAVSLIVTLATLFNRYY